MLETEYIKSMSLNYERVKLPEKPEENKYQYCILSRGGIGGLLSCTMRFINTDAFMYYDITSKQPIDKLLQKKKIDREWLKNFVWNVRYIKNEINRFLLDDRNVMWYPEQIYQDIDDTRWNVLYYPYYEGRNNSFDELLKFVVDKVDYADKVLSECVYKIYEQYAQYGDAYFKEKVLDDIKMLEKEELLPGRGKKKEHPEKMTDEEFVDYEVKKFNKIIGRYVEEDEEEEEEEVKPSRSRRETKKGLFKFLESARKRDKEERDKIRRENRYFMELTDDDMVAEDDEDYGDIEPEDLDDDFETEKKEAEYGKTIYIENVAEATDEKRRLYDEDEKVLAVLGEEPFVIGKKKDSVDLVLDHTSVSRLHARIAKEGEDYYLEDMNSTNGTFKNEKRLRPYEKRKLIPGDEIRFGSVTISFK